jgi:site-specific recombinase XerD
MRFGAAAFFVGSGGGVLMKTAASSNPRPAASLSRVAAEYVSHKRSLGFKFVIEENVLQRFCLLGQQYVAQENEVPPALIATWFRRRPNEKANTFYARRLCVKNFLQFAMDLGLHSEIPEIQAHRTPAYVPHIFSDAEIKRFFAACDAVPRYAGTLRHVLVPVIFRLLYYCGLRVSEAIGLKRGDVDLLAGVLTIREPKNRQDRYVPMSSSMTAIMRRFSLLDRPSPAKETDNFFTSKHNDHLTRSQVYHWFRLCLEKAGIAHRGKGHGPREHDLRHTFCVHSLKSLCLHGADLYCFLPLLSTYVGHKSIQATQRYLRMTADVFPDLIENIAACCGHVIPELKEAISHETN